jgi:hypothetical protein
MDKWTLWNEISNLEEAKERIFDVVIDWQIQPTQTIILFLLLNNYEI